MRAYPFQAPKGRGENPVHQDKENLAKMGYQANQVFKAPLDPKELRESLDLPLLVFLDLRVKRGQEGCLDL